jgi:predicted AlkP superfamily phosphohydrolase/phosphomutase
MGSVVVVGLDGATFDVMRPMMARGRLKNFSALVNSGCSRGLQTVVPANSAAAWNSFATGVNPAKHGVFEFMWRVKGTYTYAPVTSRDRKARTIWQIASEAGLRCCVVNIPMTYPPEPLNGIMISGFPFPEWKRDFAYPSAILDEISEKLGVRGFLKPSPHFMNEGGQEGLLHELLTVTEDQGKVVAHLMERERWDLMVTVFDATDVAGHFFWQYLDRTSASGDQRSESYGDFLYRVYDKVDEAFGMIRARTRPEDTVFVMSDHGMGPSYHTVYLNNFLMKNGYLKTKRSVGSRARKALFRMGVTTGLLLDIAKKTGLVSPKTYGFSKKSARLGVARFLTLSADDIDWRSTRAYSHSSGGGIFANLKGREPLGIVEPGGEYETLVSELKQKLSSLRNERNGEMVFDRVVSKDQVYRGPSYEDAFDIQVVNNGSTYRPVALFDFGSRRIVTTDQRISGSHRKMGIFIAGGEEIAPQSLSENAQLMDMAPTILHLLGLPVPPVTDGRVLTEILAPGGESACRQPRFAEPDEGKVFRSAARKLAEQGDL